MPKNSSHASPYKVAIIGTGFGGLCMAIQLKKAGIDSFVILEKADGVGGTWRDNSYPGAACDVQSHLYSYSFEPKHDWSRKFAGQQEILGYLEDCADKYELHPHIKFGCEVTSASFDDSQSLWNISDHNGNTVQAHCLVTACGQLNRPSTPKLQGIEHFKGTVFHSARWNHDYDLNGKSVAVIGTGASAIQFVPEIVKQVKSLTLFQRSAAWVISKSDRPFKSIEQKLFASIPVYDKLYRYLIYWKNESRALAFTRFYALLEAFALETKWMARKHIKDPLKRAKSIPDYQIGCKRLLISNDWFPALNRDNLQIETNGIKQVTETSIVTTEGAEYEVDAIIYGTGFAATQFLAPMHITGLNGIDLNTAWNDGAEAFKGICVSGFPNLFMLYGPNTNLAHSSIVFMLEAQVNYVMKCLHALENSTAQAMDVKPKRQAEYSQNMQARLKGSVWDSGCTSWYITDSGKNTNNWPGFTFSFRLMTNTLSLDDYSFNG